MPVHPKALSTTPALRVNVGLSAAVQQPWTLCGVGMHRIRITCPGDGAHREAWAGAGGWPSRSNELLSLLCCSCCVALGKSRSFHGKLSSLPTDCEGHGLPAWTAYDFHNQPDPSLEVPKSEPGRLCCDCDSQLGTLCSLPSGKPVAFPLPPGPSRFQEVLFAALMEGTQCLGHRHIPCRQLSRASSWEDGSG